MPLLAVLFQFRCGEEGTAVSLPFRYGEEGYALPRRVVVPVLIRRGGVSPSLLCHSNFDTGRRGMPLAVSSFWF